MSEIEGGGGGSVEGGGSGEVSSSSEVSETSAAETGGESSEATQEAATEEAVNLAVLMKILTLLNLQKIAPRSMMSLILIPRENQMTAKRLVFLRVTM